MSAPKLTERIVSELLREKHTKTGNGGGGEYAYMAGVRNGAGFDAVCASRCSRSRSRAPTGSVS